MMRIGDRVHADNRYWKIPAGATGTVVGIGDDYVYVEWDNNIDGHDCDGRSKLGHGGNIPCDMISLIRLEPIPLSEAEIDLLLT